MTRRKIVFASVLLAATLPASGCILGLGTGKPEPADIKEKQREVEVDHSGRFVYLQPVPTEKRPVVKKEYAVGTQRIAGVGEAMVGYRNFTAATQVSHVIAVRDFVQLCRPLDRSGGRGSWFFGQSDDDQRRASDRGRPRVPEADDYGEPSYDPNAMADMDSTAASRGRPKRVTRSDNRETLSDILFEDDPSGAGEGRRNASNTAAWDGELPELPEEEPYISPEEYERMVERSSCRSIPLRFLRGEAGDRLQVGGSFLEGGEIYYLVQFDSPEGTLYMAVDRYGRIKKGDYAAWLDIDDEGVVTPIGVPLEYVSTRVSMDTDTPLFKYGTDESSDPEAPRHLHYEITYGGTTYDHRGLVYHLKYQEYRRDAQEEPNFTKALVFTGNQRLVDVLGLQIQVHDVNDAAIVYTVLRD